MFKNISVVILPPGNLEGGAGIGLTTLIPCNDLNFTPIPVLTLGDVKMPHTIIDQLVSASLYYQTL